MFGTLAELAARINGEIVGDGNVTIERITTVDEATGDSLTFATDEKYLAAALASSAAAVLVDAAIRPDVANKPLLVVANARHALAQLLASMRASEREPFRHPSAVVESDAQLPDDLYVGAHAYVGHRVSIGSKTVIEAGAFIGDDVIVGASARIHPNASVMQGCRIGDRVVLHAGSVIGSEGFGWAFVDGRTERIPQVGNVELDDDVEVGANTCIDRAQTGSTRIGAGTKIDNLVQIGHNCRIGKHCVIAALTGLAGSTVIGDYVKVAGQVGFRGHITVGSGVTIAGQSGIWGDVADGATVSGNPARDHRETMRREVMIRALPKLIDRVEALERARANETE